MLNNIVVKGARENNLKNLDVTIPRNKFVVMTGVSGSGKTTLAFGTIFAEGQRRFMESLSSYARQFLGQIQKPAVDEIHGLSPSIAINQKTTSHNPRSTVGTVTEIYDYLRLLFARVGEPHCPECDKKISRQSVDQIVEQILGLWGGELVSVEAPVIRGKKGSFEKEILAWRKSGYARVRIDGSDYMLDEVINLDKNIRHTISIIVDRLKINSDDITRLVEAVEASVRLSDGLITIGSRTGESRTFSNKYACIDCNLSIEDLEPRMFSFNSPFGACAHCSGIGSLYEIDKARDMTPEIAENLRRWFHESKSDFMRGEIGKLMVQITCPVCNGRRLKREALAVKIGGINISELTSKSITDTLVFFENLALSKAKMQTAERIVVEIVARLKFLINVGLHYLTLARSADSLSGGENQRIRLATQIGSGLVGVLYILDEPSIGLHQYDNEKLLKTLKSLRDLGNTLIVVEHDEETIRAADYIVDIGPRAGIKGGKLVAAGSVTDIENCEESMTGQYLRGTRKIEVPKKYRTSGGFVEVQGARENNLKNINVKFPVGVLTAVTGVSGSGKSSLVNKILYPALYNALHKGSMPVGVHNTLCGADVFDKVINIDQSPIGRTPRSNPATYTGVFGPIRELFASSRDAKERGYAVGRFSFNVRGGRCDNCDGEGIQRIEMHFLPDVFVPCEVCGGKRFNRETLEVRFKSKNIYDVLEMTVDEGVVFFENIQAIYKKLKILQDVGLGYIRLGQSATTLSGGEAQRVKLATELARTATGKTLYILDEPTTGLHSYDVHKLINILQRLVDAGNTVIVIEHNLDVIKTADYIIDMGPNGGDGGGRVVAAGSPREVAKNLASVTGKFLEKIL